MTVLAIKKAKNHLFSVTLSDGKTEFLDKDTVAEEGLHEGDEISNERLKELLSSSQKRRAVARSLWYLEQGDMSKRALVKKLTAAKFDKGAMEYAVIRMQEVGLINDQRYAERLAEKLLSACVSRREALVKMQNKGLDRQTAQSALDLFECDETAQIKALIIKKYKNRLTDEESVRKVFAALQRKGVGYSNIKAVLRQYSEELQNSED